MLAPAAARADFGDLYRDYTNDGAINGCKHSPAELRAGLGQIPADVRQYDPGFEQALEGALEQRVGGCGTLSLAPSGSGGTRTTADGSPGPRSAGATSAQAVSQGHGVPAVIVAMIVLLGAVLLVAALFGLAAYFGWNLERAAMPAGGRARRLGELLSDRLYAVRDRLGF
jgi:hypothetical protein